MIVAETVGEGWSFNPPPHWPRPPHDWRPSPGWQPDPRWGPVPPGWQLWVRSTPTPRRPWRILLAGLTAALLIGVLGVRIPRVAAAPPNPVTTTPAVPTPSPIPTSTPTPTPAPTPATRSSMQAFPDCPHLNAVYPHGVGLPTAVDKPIRTPVTDFGRSVTLYRANLRLDLDHDGIACERH